ncbi:MAG: PEP-CTERM sorting domain-containing protein [Kiritimatiellales bacterium]|nr:PEP-CTERM sorting domain-containing protein [Kiritimatiellales bacterium]
MKINMTSTIAGTLLLVVTAHGQAYTPAFSVVNGGPSGLPGDNVYQPGPALVLPGIGVWEVDAISGNQHGIPEEWVFSVDIGSVGAPGSAVNQEATLPLPGDHPADIYRSAGLGLNGLDWDGDGVANPLLGPSLGLIEQPPLGDDVDGLEVHGLAGNIYYSLSQASAVGIGFDGATLFLNPAAPGYDAAPSPFAFAAQLGLLGGGADDLDAVVVYDANGLWDPGDQIFFSLTAGSATLAANGWSAADILVSQGGIVGLAVSAAQLGLNGATDNIDALDVIPEPSVILLLAIGGAGFYARKRLLPY